MTNQLSEIETRNNILGTEIIGFDGYGEYNGVIEELSVEEHRILGTLKFVWVRWLDGCKEGILEHYFPNQFRHISKKCGIGVYFQ